MHEASLVEALFDQVDRAIGAHPPAAVREVTVRIGALAGVEAALFRTAFEGLRGDRGYGGATLAVDEERASWRCADCGGEVPEGALLACAKCGGRVTLAAGGEIILARVELEVNDV